jgi:hypothetical protein
MAGELDVPLFREAWQQVVDRHPLLRTRFLWREVSTPIQIVLPAAALLGARWMCGIVRQANRRPGSAG